MKDYKKIEEAITEIKLDVPARLRKGVLRGNQKASLVSGLETLDYILDLIGKESYEGLDILDYGCGVKFMQAILQFDLPFKSYHGMDIDKTMLDFMNEYVKHPDVKFDILPFYNELYNESGADMTRDYKLPCGDKKFDVITLQSVLTHFNPHDFEVCLAMLKNYLKPDGKVFFTCILSPGQVPKFMDLNPERPLLRASYDQDYAKQLVVDAGLQIDIFKRRGQHRFFPEHLICSLPDAT